MARITDIMRVSNATDVNLLVSDDFSSSSLSPEWKVNHPTAWIADGWLDLNEGVDRGDDVTPLGEEPSRSGDAARRWDPAPIRTGAGSWTKRPVARLRG
jgi:hypothetical protein